jgi:hypothetical protein
MKEYTRDDVTRNILNKIRSINEENEKEEKKKIDAVAITDDPRFGQNALQNQINSFRSSVESGAQFTKPENGKVAESPLIYMPSNGNIIFSGTIPCLNNLKWQFVLKTTTGNGCFIWSDGLILNKDNIQILNKLYGYYLNWKDQWNAESADLDKMVHNMQENN